MPAFRSLLPCRRTSELTGRRDFIQLSIQSIKLRNTLPPLRSNELFGGVASSNLLLPLLRRVHHGHQTSALPAAIGLLLQDHKPLSAKAFDHTTWRLHVARSEVAPHKSPSIRDRHLLVLRNVAQNT